MNQNPNQGMNPTQPNQPHIANQPNIANQTTVPNQPNMMYPGYPYTPKVRQYYLLNAKDRVFALLLLLFTIVAVSWSLFEGFRLGFTVSYVLLFILETVYCKKVGEKPGVFAVLCAVLSLASSVVFSLTLNGFVQFVLLNMIVLMNVVWVDALSGAEKESGDLGLFRKTGHVIARAFYLTTGIGSLFHGEKTKKGNAGVKVFVGAICALPVLLIVVPLLMNADAAFEGMLGSVTESIGESAMRIFVGVLFAPLVISFFLGNRFKKAAKAKESTFAGIDNVYIIAFLGVLSVCYLAYLFSQLAYFFSAFGGFLPEGYDFVVSEYARRGFFEMSFIALVNFVLVFGCLILAKKREGQVSLWVKLTSGFISLFTLLLIATALSKMVLYIRSFGMTELRILTSAFMVFLAVTFLCLTVRIFVSAAPVVRTALIAAVCILLTLGFGNVRGFIASYNISAYENGTLQGLDVTTIANLGDAGIPYLTQLADNDNETIAQEAQELIAYEIDRYFDSDYKNGETKLTKKKQSVFAWNYTAQKAQDALSVYYDAYPERIPDM